MTDATFPIEVGETVTAFELSALQETPYPGTAVPGVDDLTYCFVNGFVAVGDLPCRRALRADIASRAAPELTQFDAVATALPGFNRRLEFSGFWHRPTRLVRWARTTLHAPVDGAYPFSISTPGGVHIWVDGQLALTFEPFTRNVAQSIDAILPLKSRGSEVVIRLEEMAERDTNFFVEMTSLSPDKIAAAISGAADPQALTDLMALARAVRPGRTVFDGTAPLSLVFDQAPSRPVTIRARVGQSVHLSHLPPRLDAVATLPAGETTVVIATLDDLQSGYHPLSLTLELGDNRIERGIAFALNRQPKPENFDPDLTARKAHALQYAAIEGEHRPGRTLARLHLDLPFDDTDAQILSDTLDGINGRRDCSDFVMVPVLWIRLAYGGRIPPDWRDQIDAAVLGYRYWVDEPGNDTMWFWSENHALCFHVSQYLAGLLYPDATFSNAGLTGAQHLALAEHRLEKWFNAVEEHGLAEWNSAAYYPIDLIGLTALQHLAQGKLRDRASGLLDRLFEMVALHTVGGVPAGSMGRAYDKELRAGPMTELAPIAALAFGTGWLNDGVAALPLLAATDYTPPAHCTRWTAPAQRTAIEARYVQGYGPAAKLALWKTAHMQLSASIDGPPGSKGHQQHVIDVQAMANPFARAWINHPGEDDPWGAQRPSYWAGNGVMPRVGMHCNTGLMLFDLGTAPKIDFAHAYAPLGIWDAHIAGPDFLVLQSGEGFAILKATGAITPVKHGPGAGIEHRVHGAQTGWAVITGDLDGPLNVIARRAEALSLTLSAGTLTLVDGSAPALRLSADQGLYRGDTAQDFPTNSNRPRVTTHHIAT